MSGTAENEREVYTAMATQKEEVIDLHDEGPETGQGAGLGRQSLSYNLPGTRDRASLPIKSPVKLPGATSGILVTPVVPKVVSLSVEQPAAGRLKLIKPLRSKLKGWDLSMSWNAVLGEERGGVFRLSDDPTQSDFPGLFTTEVINGSPRRLYGVAAENYDNSGTPFSRIEYTYLQVRLNRQMASGWRFGIGVVGLFRRSNDEKRIREVATMEDDSSLYYGVYKTEDNYWIMQGEMGYTLRLGKRWGPWLAASINVGLQSRENYTAYILHEGQLSRTLTVQSRSSGLAGTNSNVYMALSGGLQYRLTNRFSVGFNVGYIPGGRDLEFPLPGFEVRTHF